MDKIITTIPMLIGSTYYHAVLTSSPGHICDKCIFNGTDENTCPSIYMENAYGTDRDGFLCNCFGEELPVYFIEAPELP